MSPCRTCKHWGEPRESAEQLWGTCAQISEDSTVDGPGGAPSTMALAFGREPGEGVLMTRWDFGCVEWAARPPEGLKDGTLWGLPVLIKEWVEKDEIRIMVGTTPMKLDGVLRVVDGKWVVILDDETEPS